MRTIAAGLDLTQLVGVFLTHHHSDHISDLATLAIARWSTGCAAPLAVHAPDGPAARFADTCLDAFDDDCFHAEADPGDGPRPRDHRGPPRCSDQRRHHRDGHPGMDRPNGPRRPSPDRTRHGLPHRTVRRRHHGQRRNTRVCDGVRALAHGAEVVVHEALLAERVSSALLTWNASAESVGERSLLSCGPPPSYSRT